MRAPQAFVQALQKHRIACALDGCPGSFEAVELTQIDDRVKAFDLRCDRCGRTERIAGQEQLDPPWDDASLLEIADEHLLHLQPVCPYDQAPVQFHSLPNPRRKARYLISCYFCGRQAELEWPPPEAKW